ncbi:ATP-binding response regulator [Aestuariispira insulae]|uniref:histidine kinase n=1 Tax=Aestuariispira insulae TaxID=1461337 RepID=A0A3D9HMQ4_9PROT|nr:hybrid sensor histidine kinase/response regulator [Aestuariispira insulae]RED50782.1 signal transduction histidine kinase [Aestuariispira insulae]
MNDPLEEDFLIDDEDGAGTDAVSDGVWKILVVDDEINVISATKLALNDFVFEGRRLEFLSATSGREAREILSRENDIALVLLDVTMESEHEGLDVARWIREVLENQEVRIVLRTGQPGQAPEREVVIKYDINDYKEKTDLSYRKMFTMMVSVLRSYRDLVNLRQYQEKLEDLVENQTRGLKSEIEMRQAKEHQLLEAEQQLMIKNAKLESALKQQKEMTNALRQFVSVTSHEIRTPVAIIDGLVQRLIRNVGQSSTDYAVKKYDQIRSAIARLEECLELLHAGAALDGDMLDFHPVDLDLKAELTRLVSKFADMDSDRELKLDIDGLPDHISADREALNHIVSNLISNALKYSPDGKPVEISGRSDENAIIISVRDHGIGIEDNDQGNIFRQFYRGSNVSGISGTGLGLYLVRKLAQKHKGDVSVKSTKGKGSVFSVRLPLKR